MASCLGSQCDKAGAA